VGERDVHGVAIGVGIDRHRAQSYALGCTHDPARDLAAIGDQQLVEAPGERHHHILLLTCIDFSRVFSRIGGLPTILSQRSSASLTTCALPKSELIYSEVGG